MIPITYRANLSYLLKHPLQLALALLGIGIGVAVIVAVDLANASARKAFLLSMDAVAGEATHQVIGGPRGIDESVYVNLRRSHGVREIAPVVETQVVVDDITMTLIGIDLFAESEMRTFTGQVVGVSAGSDESLIRELLTMPGAVTLAQRMASMLNLSPGDSFDISVNGRVRKARLLGVFGDNESEELDGLVVTDIATAQSWTGMSGRLSRIDARLADDAALAQLRSVLPASARVLNAAGRTRQTAEMSDAFMTNLTAMSLLALLVGLFLIYNSVSFSVLQRRELIGMLRALGFTRGQIVTSVVVEATVIGLIAAALGALVGVWLGQQLLALVSQSINDLYFRVTVTDVSVDMRSIAKGLVAGVAAAIAAAALPAVEAMSFPPRLTMLRSSLERRTGKALPMVATAGLAVMAMAAAVLLLSGRNLVAGLTAVFMLILGFALCVPIAIRHAATMLAPLATWIAGMPARMAVSGIAASLSRTAVAIVALAVAVSATIGVSVMVDSFRGSVAAWLDTSLQADVYAGVQRGTLDASVARDITSIDGVVHFSTSRRVLLEGPSSRTQLIAIQMAPGSYAGTSILDADPDEVWPQWDSADAVLVSEPYAYRNRVSRGGEVTLPTDNGFRDFEIAGIYESYDVNASAVLMSRTTYERHFEDDGFDTLGLYLSPQASADEVIKSIEVISSGTQDVRVNSNTKIRELSLAVFDRTFVITDVLYWLAIGVAFIGILGAMLALQLERAREYGVLRAVGMTPAQLGGMITTQTAVIGLLSGLAALPLGIMMAYVLIEVINRRAFGWQIDMSVAPGILGSAVAFAVIAALLAGIYPAIRAATGNPAAGMREE